MKPSGLTVAQLGLLRHRELAERITISELAKIMRIDRTTLNRNMKPLSAAGLMTVIPGKDSRTREAMLAKAGKDAVGQGCKTAVAEYARAGVR